jgi:hypothetical protein
MAVQEVPATVRLPDWERRLFALIEANKSRPFVWGEFDCAQWGSMCLEAVTGRVSELNKRKRKTEKAALKMLKERGGLMGILTAELGEAVNPKMTKRGDICLLQNGERHSVGVCVGTHSVCTDNNGLVSVPMSKAVAAWHI